MESFRANVGRQVASLNTLFLPLMYLPLELWNIILGERSSPILTLTLCFSSKSIRKFTTRHFPFSQMAILVESASLNCSVYLNWLHRTLRYPIANLSLIREAAAFCKYQKILEKLYLII